MNEEQFYQNLEQDLVNQKAIMNKAVELVLDQEVTDYPIFVLHQAPIEIGVALIEGGNIYSKWYIQVSSLEELATKQIIRADRIAGFREIYKDPTQYFCLLLINDAKIDFLFLPRT